MISGTTRSAAGPAPPGRVGRPRRGTAIPCNYKITTRSRFARLAAREAPRRHRPMPPGLGSPAQQPPQDLQRRPAGAVFPGGAEPAPRQPARAVRPGARSAVVSALESRCQDLACSTDPRDRADICHRTPRRPARMVRWAGRPAHTPARCPYSARTSPVPACAGTIRGRPGPVPPAAWGDVAGPRRLRVPDLTPSKSNRARSGTLQLCSVSEKQQGKGD